MATVIDGRKLADEITQDVCKSVVSLGSEPPGLATLLVGSDPASAVYVRNKHRTCRGAGMHSFQVELPAEIDAQGLLAEVERLNADPKVHGILVQPPRPREIDPGPIVAAIEILVRHQVAIEGSRAVVSGRSGIVSQPGALLSLHDNALTSAMLLQNPLQAHQLQSGA